MPSFDHPFILLFLLLLPTIFVGQYILNKKQKKKAVFYTQLHLLIPLIKNKKNTVQLVKMFSEILRYIAIGSLVIALAGPYTLAKTSLTKKKGIDIFLCLDVSLSMNAQDLKPNRLEAAKETAIKFIDQLDADRLGIIIFSGKAITEAPLTFDYSVIKQLVSEIKLRTAEQTRPDLEGTAMGTAIASAVEKLKDDQTDRTKIIILLSDGEANKGIDPIIASRYSQESNIKIYTIGIGTQKGVAIPIITQNGDTIYAQNADGSMQRSYLDTEVLKKIAEISEGQFYLAEEKEELLRIYKSISELEKKEIEVETINEKQSIAALFLILGIGSLITEILIRFSRFSIYQ